MADDEKRRDDEPKGEKKGKGGGDVLSVTGAFGIAEATDLTEELAFLDDLEPVELVEASPMDMVSSDGALFDEVDRLAEAVGSDAPDDERERKPFTIELPSVACASPPREEGDEELPAKAEGSTVAVPSALFVDPLSGKARSPKGLSLPAAPEVEAPVEEPPSPDSAEDPSTDGAPDPAPDPGEPSPSSEEVGAPSPSPSDHGAHDPLEGEAWVRRVRKAASRILAPLIDRIDAIALGEDVDLAGTALQALGRIAYPPSVRVLKEAVASRPAVALEAVKALAAYDSLLAYDALKEVAFFGPKLELRGEAAEALAVFGEDDCFDVWARLARSPEIFLRAKVAKGLSRRADSRSEDLLLSMGTSASEPAVFIEVMKALRKVGSRRGVPVLMERFARHEDAHARATCLTTLLALAAPEGEALALEALKDEDRRVRANAVELLGGLASESTLLPVLGPLLTDGDARVRANAAVALHPHDPREAARVIHKMLEHHQKRFRAAAAWAAGRIGDASCLERLLILLNTEFDKDVIQAALGVLDGLAKPALGGRLAKLLSHPNPVIRMKAADGYAASVDPAEARREIEARFRDETDPKVRSSLVRSLQKVCTASEYGALKSKIIDSDERVVANAIEAMDALGVVEIASLVRGFLGHESPRVRVAAVLASWRMGRLDTLETLRSMLEDGDGRERRAAVAAVGLLVQGIDAEQLERHRFLADSLLEWKPAAGEESRHRVVDEAPEAVLEADVEAKDRSRAHEEQALALVVAMRHRDDGAAAEALESLLWEGEGVEYARLASFELRTRGEALSRLWEEKGRSLGQPGLVERFAEMEGRGGKDPRKLRLLLEIVECHLEHLGELAARARQVVEAGEDVEPVLRILTTLKETLRLRPTLDGDLGATWFYAKEPERAFVHLLRGLLHDPHDLNLLWKFARTAARLGRFRLAARAAREIASEAAVHMDVRKAANRFLEKLRHAGKVDED